MFSTSLLTCGLWPWKIHTTWELLRASEPAAPNQFGETESVFYQNPLVISLPIKVLQI